MHGNTFATEDGTKTRSFDAILAELMETFTAHEQCGTWLGGVHFELTGENVTECVGGSSKIGAADLGHNYESFCDPRLNWEQSIEMAFKMVEVLKRVRK
jgi:3-deoxy-D-arabino-heptulosonate 7-phosphate (DAHP) synthase class II